MSQGNPPLPPEGAPAAPEKQPLNVKKEIFEWVRAIVIALVAVFLIRTFLFTMIRVDGQSMIDTLHDADRLAVTIIDMKLNGPQRGQIVICTYPGADHYCVKRVVGMPGETIEIKNGVTYINGEVFDEPYVEYASMASMPAQVIGEDCYFVMGDNRANSLDSRDSRVGALPRDAFLGVAHLRLWPFDRIGTLD